MNIRLPPVLVELFKYNRKFLAGFVILVVILLMGIIGPLIYPVDPENTSFKAKLPPSPEHPLGTDALGRDVLAQVLNGIKSSLYVGLLAGLIATGIAIVIGSISGVKGGLIDEALMAITNAVLLLPTVLILILIAALFRVRSLELVAVFIGVTSWPWLARTIRAEFMSLKERDFVYMSLLAGESEFRIAIFDLLPNMATYIGIATAEMIADAILAEAGLSFVGLGPTRGVTLGRILYWVETCGEFAFKLWWWWLPPVILIIAIATSMVTITLSLDEVFNPRLRGR